jgi:hypothetical protein
MQKYAAALEDYWKTASQYTVPVRRGDNAV